VGQPEEIAEQLQELERQGLNQVMFCPPVSSQYRLSEDIARRVMSRM
jgi:alkanesulfonate monooxygenase SsuD/methylene tetrahydromethanopterin reductase-like flavin-dependent oxidoreductase (luciferase family)